MICHSQERWGWPIGIETMDQQDDVGYGAMVLGLAIERKGFVDTKDGVAWSGESRTQRRLLQGSGHARKPKQSPILDTFFLKNFLFILFLVHKLKSQ